MGSGRPVAAASRSFVDRVLRDAKLYEIGSGTNEVRRMLIGRELFEKTG